jgi:hypothetical protein
MIALPPTVAVTSAYPTVVLVRLMIASPLASVNTGCAPTNCAAAGIDRELTLAPATGLPAPSTTCALTVVMLVPSANASYTTTINCVFGLFTIRRLREDWRSRSCR